MMANNYETYEALDFAQDDSFIRWARGVDDADRRFWESWRESHPEKAEELEAARRLVQSLRVKDSEPTDEQIDQLWDKIDAATPVSKDRKARRIRLRRIMQYAAAAAIGLLFFFWMFNPSQSVYSGDGQLLFRLPDGSSINLNEGSAISYKSRRWQQARTIELRGEAFFSVVKGSPFTVVTPRGKVEVLGTSFSVRAVGSDFEVKCLTGQVAVTHENDRQVLSARQSTRLQADGRLSTPAEAARPDIANWRNVEITLNAVPLTAVFEELERQFGVEVRADMENDQRLVNVFFNNNRLDSALYYIDYAVSNIEIESRGDTIVVSDSDF